MLTLIAQNGEGAVFPLPPPRKLTLERAYGVPADSCAAVFSGAVPQGLHRLRLLLAGRCVLDGVVDEQRLTHSGTGATSTLYARSLAALLLDTQMKPLTLQDAGTQDLFCLAAQPFGFFHNLPETQYPGQFHIPNGMSCWTALSRFLRLSRAGELTLEGALLTLFRRRREPPLHLSNTREDGIPYLTAEWQSRRCGRVAAVRYKTQQEEDYPWTMENADAIREGAAAVRYVNLSETPPSQWEAELSAVLFQGDGEARGAAVTLPGCRMEALGRPVALPEDFTQEEPLYLAAVRIAMDETGTTTRWILRPAAYFQEREQTDSGAGATG